MMHYMYDASLHIRGDKNDATCEATCPRHTRRRRRRPHTAMRMQHDTRPHICRAFPPHTTRLATRLTRASGLSLITCTCVLYGDFVIFCVCLFLSGEKISFYHVHLYNLLQFCCGCAPAAWAPAGCASCGLVRPPHTRRAFRSPRGHTRLSNAHASAQLAKPAPRRAPSEGSSVVFTSASAPSANAARAAAPLITAKRKASIDRLLPLLLAAR